MKRDSVLEQLVIEEATNLRNKATSKELSKLDYENLAGESTTWCIYGQMTGNCESLRAFKLIKKCAKKVYEVTNNINRFKNLELNGAPKIVTYSSRNSYYFSPIEIFVNKYKPKFNSESRKIKKLVSFLKGDTQELIF